MNLMVKSAEKECKSPVMKSGIRQPPAKAFMDDLTIATTHTIQARWLLSGLESINKWARMKFNAKKSRSMILKKGKQEARFRFKFYGNIIPTVAEQPIKCLGKVFNVSCKDTENIKNTVQQTRNVAGKNRQKWSSRKVQVMVRTMWYFATNLVATDGIWGAAYYSWRHEQKDQQQINKVARVTTAVHQHRSIW